MPTVTPAYTFEIFDSYGDGIFAWSELDGVRTRLRVRESHEFVVPWTPAPTLSPTIMGYDDLRSTL